MVEEKFMSRDNEGVEEIQKIQEEKVAEMEAILEAVTNIKRASQSIQQTFHSGSLRGEMIQRKAQRPNMLPVAPFELDYRSKAVAWNNSICFSIRGLPPTDQSLKALGKVAVIASLVNLSDLSAYPGALTVDLGPRSLGFLSGATRVHRFPLHLRVLSLYLDSQVKPGGELGGGGTALCSPRGLNASTRAPLGERRRRAEPGAAFLHLCLRLSQSRAQPPEDTRRKPVLGKLGTLFTAGRRRNSRNGLESPTNSNTKSASTKLPETESEKNKAQGSQPKPTNAGSGQEAEGQPAESFVQTTPCDAELSPCSSSSVGIVQQCHDSDSVQLEPLQAEGETFPNATTAAKELHSSPKNRSGQESAETLARSSGEDALPGAAGLQPETARGVSGSPPEERLVGGLGEAPDGAPGVGAEAGSLGTSGDAVAPGESPSLGAETSRTARSIDRAHPSKVLTLDIYLSKTEVAQVDELVPVAPGTDDCDDSDDMERR
ncbi:uncharacterized protein LOC118238085, partial [Cricetulus griseus]|uniref:uncharacterized protein LOC118238085 n=1 Tax=Cricetulus griseus TaxID=10029 RepID=UPI0015C3475A